MRLKPNSHLSSSNWMIPRLWERLFARSLRGYWQSAILTDDDPLRCRMAFENGFFQNESHESPKT